MLNKLKHYYYAYVKDYIRLKNKDLNKIGDVIRMEHGPDWIVMGVVDNYIYCKFKKDNNEKKT